MTLPRSPVDSTLKSDLPLTDNAVGEHPRERSGGAHTAAQGRRHAQRILVVIVLALTLIAVVGAAAGAATRVELTVPYGVYGGTALARTTSGSSAAASVGGHEIWVRAA